MDIVTYSRRTIPAAPSRPDPDADRVAWVDTAKGICIILVVAMHATLGIGAETGREGWMHAVVAYSKPFRMPDFFLVSGLFLSRVIDRDWRTYADKRVVHFAYFYVLWLLIQSALKYNGVSGGSPAGFAAHLARSIVEPFSTLWFIYMLAVFSVVTKLLRAVPASAVLAAACVLQILPIHTGFTLVDEFAERWVFFLAGYMLAPAIFRFAAGARARAGVALGGLAVWAIINGALALTPTGVPVFPTLAELPLVGLALGVAGALAIVTAASLLTAAGAVAAPLRYCGAQSIAIYLAFFLPMAATRSVLIKTGIIADTGTMAAVTTAVAVIAPLLLERLVRNTPLRPLFRRPAWAHLPAPRPAGMAVPAAAAASRP